MLRRALALRHAGVVFIRKTATRARRNGGSYTSFRLVESLRSGQACLLEPDPALLGEAERIAEALRLRGLDAPAEQAIAVHLDSLEHSRVRSVGCERLALHALDQLGLQDALRAQGVSARDAAVAAALVVARMVHPSSEHAAHAWLAGSSATLELLGLERAKPLSLSKLYRTSDLLWKHREAEVRALHAGLARKGCTKRYDKVLERLGRLKERYRQVAGQYDIAVERGSGKGRAAQLATAIRIEPNGKHPARDAQAGMYVLRTSHTQWGPERVVQTYWQLAEIEAAFRSLKGEAGLRSSWETIRRQLAGWVRLTTSLRAADGRWIQCRQDSRPDAKAAELARAIGLMPGLHRMRTSHAADATPSPSSTQ